MLALVDPVKNKDKFFILQLISRVDDYVVYSRWGRTGALVQSLHQNFDKVGDGIKCFRTKFEQKTGLTWENRGNPTIGNKYRYIKQNFSEKRDGYESARWQYWVDDGVDEKTSKWYDYSATGSIQVEQLYQEHLLNGNLTNRLVESGYFAYSVNLVQMTQTNMKHPKRTTRRIRRVLSSDTAASIPQKLNIQRVTASSNYGSSYTCENVLNGRMGQDGGADWSTNGEGVGAWIHLELETAKMVTQLKFAGRVRDDKFKRVRVSFSDGSLQELEFPNNAHLNSFDLSPVTTTFIRITCLTCHNTAHINRGAQAIKILGVPV